MTEPTKRYGAQDCVATNAEYTERQAANLKINPGPLKLRGPIPKAEYPYRSFKAWEVECPRCGANPGVACIGDDAKKMRGVHRARQEALANAA